MKDLKLDDLIDVTISRARVMYATPDHSEGAGNLTVVIHRGVRYVLVTEAGRVTIAKPEPDPEPTPEPVLSDNAGKILDGLNWRLDDRRDPVLGVNWAIQQPEVAATDGPNVEGEFLVELYDGTVLEFDAKTKQWGVTVCDDTESEVAS